MDNLEEENKKLHSMIQNMSLKQNLTDRRVQFHEENLIELVYNHNLLVAHINNIIMEINNIISILNNSEENSHGSDI